MADFITVPKAEWDELKRKVGELTDKEHDKEVIRQFVKSFLKPVVWLLEKAVLPIAIAAATAYVLK